MAPPRRASVPNKKTRRMLSLCQKLEVITKLEKGHSRTSLMEEYGVGSSTIYDIKKQKDVLLQFSQSSAKKTITKRKNLRKPHLQQLDAVLYEWFKVKRSEGRPITGPILTEKAKQFCEELNISEEDAGHFSPGWLSRFKARHGIQRLDISGETRSADAPAAEEFTATWVNLVEEHDLSADQVYNADETALFYRCLPSSTLALGETDKAKGFKKNKDRVTVLLCSNASGNHKVKPLVIGKFQRPRAFRGLTHLPVNYKAQKSAWMTSTIFTDWFQHNFVPEVKENLRRLGKPENSKVILLLDNCRAHPPENELVSGQIFTTCFPPNVTSLIQPMDQGVIQNMKCHYRSDFLRRLVASDMDVQHFQSSVNVKDAVYGVACAWRQVKPETLRACWKKLWPTLLVRESSAESDASFEGFVPGDARPAAAAAVNDLRAIVASAPVNNPVGQLDHTELENWVNIENDVPVAYEPTDEDIINSVISPSETSPSSQVDSEDDDVIAEKTVTWAQADQAFKTLLTFSETKPCYDAHEVMQLRILQSHFLQKRQESLKQQDIRQLFASLSEKPAPAPRSVSPVAGPSTRSVSTASSVSAVAGPSVPRTSTPRRGPRSSSPASRSSSSVRPFNPLLDDTLPLDDAEDVDDPGVLPVDGQEGTPPDLA